MIRLLSVLYLVSHCKLIIIGIFIVFLSLSFSDQGLDLIIQLGLKNSFSDYTKFIIFISLFSLCNWFLAKLNLTNEIKNRVFLFVSGDLKNLRVEPYNDNNLAYISEIRKLHIIFPKIIASLTVIACGSPLFISGVIKNVNYSLLLFIFYISINIILVYFSNKIRLYLIKNKRIVLSLFLLFLLLFLISYNPYNLGIKKYFFYFLNIQSLSICIFIFLIVRPEINTLFLNSKNSHIEFLISLIQNDRFAKKMEFSTFSIDVLMIIILFIVVIVHVLNNMIGNIAIFFGPIGVLICGIISIVSILNFILNKIRKFNHSSTIITIIFIILLIYKLPGNNYYFQIKTNQTNIDIDKRISVKNYLLMRLCDKYEVKKDTSEIFIVSSYGGGIRAAYWTNLVLAKAFEHNSKFYDNCFSLCGASGGMIGLGIFNSIGNETKISKTNDIYNFYNKRDFLSSNIAKLFGKDFMFSFLPLKVNMSDRHNALEDDFSANFKTFSYSSNLDDNYLSYWYDRNQNFNYNKPLLISTSTTMNRGIPAIYSPVIFNDLNFGLHYDIYKEVKTMRNHFKVSKNWDVPYITAICQSARFPFISPAGHFNENEQFIDAGYYDNMGGEFTYNIANLLSKYIDSLKIDEPEIYSKAKIKILIISNSSKTQEDIFKRKNDVVVPVHGLFSSWAGHTMNIDYKLKSLGNTNKNIKVVKIELDNLNFANNGEKFIFPLGWCLSQEALDEMFKKIENIDFNKKY